MRMMGPEARLCYSESTENIKEDEFVEMLLLDGCFIIQFMRWCLDYVTTTDPFFQDWAVNSSMHDMLLFENQIPLFVLQNLFSMIKLPEEPTLSKKKFGLSLKENQLSSIHDKNIQHILGLLHYILRSVAVIDDSTNQLLTGMANTLRTLQLCKPRGFKFINNQLRRCRWVCGWFYKKNRNNNRDKLKSESIPSATESIPSASMLHTASIPSAAMLHTAGVEFESKKAEGSNPFKVSFKNGVMKIPTFTIDDGTESLYRNLIVYEQYNQEASNRYLCLHVMLMDCLIDSAEDVALLRNSKIIGNSLGDDEAVSRIFNKLGNQVCLDISDSKDHVKLFNEVNAYYEKRRYRWMATLRRDYFNSPWALIPFLAAVLLLLLTLTQTVFSILSGV